MDGSETQTGMSARETGDHQTSQEGFNDCLVFTPQSSHLLSPCPSPCPCRPCQYSGGVWPYSGPSLPWSQSTDRYGMKEFSQWTPEWSLNRPISLTNQFDFNTISPLSASPRICINIIISYRANNYRMRKSRLSVVYLYLYLYSLSSFLYAEEPVMLLYSIFPSQYPGKHLCSMIEGNFWLVCSVWYVCASFVFCERDRVGV